MVNNLTLDNFFHYYVFDPTSETLSPQDQKIAILGTVLLGLTCGIGHLICRLFLYDEKYASPADVKTAQLGPTHLLTAPETNDLPSEKKNLTLSSLLKLLEIVPDGDQLSMQIKSMNEDEKVKFLNTEFKKLKELTLMWVSSLSQSVLGGLDFSVFENLQELTISGCVPLPDNLDTLKNLKKLTITEAGLTMLPKGIENLENLESLDLQHNLFFQIPPGVFKLKNLEFLSLRGLTSMANEATAAKVGKHVDEFAFSITEGEAQNLITALPKLKKLEIDYCNVPNDSAAITILRNAEVMVPV